MHILVRKKHNISHILYGEVWIPRIGPHWIKEVKVKDALSGIPNWPWYFGGKGHHWIIAYAWNWEKNMLHPASFVETWLTQHAGPDVRVSRQKKTGVVLGQSLTGTLKAKMFGWW